jgi:hypothetical protein
MRTFLLVVDSLLSLSIGLYVVHLSRGLETPMMRDIRKLLMLLAGLFLLVQFFRTFRELMPSSPWV